MALPLVALAPAVVDLLGGVLDMFQGDKRQQAEAVLTQLKQVHAENMAQVEVNKAEAAHSSIFVAGWRPFIGWVCGVGLATYFLPKHLLGAYFYTVQCFAAGQALPYNVDAVGLMELVWGLLGLGVLRTADKWKEQRK